MSEETKDVVGKLADKCAELDESSKEHLIAYAEGLAAGVALSNAGKN